MITLNHDSDTWVTPLQLRNGRWYKREDLLRFSNGVNGKVRTSLHLARRARENGAQGLVYGGSVHAPALGRVASAAAYVGLSCQLVIGSDPDKAIRHDTVRVAVEAGAQLVRSSVAYNPALQKRAREIAADPAIFQVPYGVSTPEDWTPGETASFLREDAWQVRDLDPSIETLVLPFGSGNATAGVMYGLFLYPTNVKHIVLVGVGPDRREWLRQRLASIQVPMPEVEHLPLHPHFAEYGDRMPEHQDGIDFHPTYEGKVVRFLDQLAPDWWTSRDGTTCMWIVGGNLR